MPQQISDEQWRQLLAHPGRPARGGRGGLRQPPAAGGLLSERGTIFLVAADHPARGCLGTGGDPMAMADRRSLLERLVDGAGRPGGRRRARLAGRRRGAAAARRARGQGRDRLDEPRRPGRRLLDDGRPVHRLRRRRIERCRPRGRQDAAADRRRGPRHRADHRGLRPGGQRARRPWPDGDGRAAALRARRPTARLRLRRDTGSLARAITVAAALGTTSAYTWLKLPSCDDPETVFSATTLPCVVLGGVPARTPAADLESWGRALRQPSVRGLVVGGPCSTRRTATWPRPSRPPRRVLSAQAERVGVSLVRRRGTLLGEDPGDLVLLRRSTRAGPGPGCGCSRCRPAWPARSAPGSPRCSCCRWPAAWWRRSAGVAPDAVEAAYELAGPQLGLHPGHRLRVRRSRQPRDSHQRRRGRGGAAVSRLHEPPPPGVRAGRGRAGGGARRRHRPPVRSRRSACPVPSTMPRG